MQLKLIIIAIMMLSLCCGEEPQPDTYIYPSELAKDTAKADTTKPDFINEKSN